MKFVSMFSDEALMDIYKIILEYSEDEVGTCRLIISDSDMSRVMQGYGYTVSAAFVQRARTKLGIKARGPRSNKYTEGDMKAIQETVCNYASLEKEIWKLTVSDSDMSLILNEEGYQVNVKYVERTRKSLGIEPLGKRGGVRVGAGRPSISGATQDIGCAKLIAQHNQAVMQLSYYRRSSGALPGQSGTDVRDRFGCHTTDLDEAIKRKSKELLRKREQKPLLRPVFSDMEDDIETVEGIFSEEVDSRTNESGRKSRKGNLYNTRTNQIFTSI